VAELETASDRERILSLLLRAAHSRAPFVGLLSVHKDGLRARRALGGRDTDAGAFAALVIPREAVRVLEDAITTRAPTVGVAAVGDAAACDVWRRLGGGVPGWAMILPVTVRDRTVALLLGHRGEEPLAADDVADLLPVLGATSAALARVLASRAAAAAQKPGKRATTSPGALGADEVTALHMVVDACRNAEAWEELADALRNLVRRGMEQGDPDEDEQLQLLDELAGVEADRLNRPELAIEAWRSALTIDATNPRVLANLERLLVATERWADVAGLLERRAALSEDPADKIALRLQLADVALDRLHRPARAIDAYQKILAIDPAHETAANRLEDLYGRGERWRPLVDLLLDRAARHEDPRACVAALETVAEIYDQRLGDARAAFLVWLTVIRREPERSDLVDDLARLGAAADAWPELVPLAQGLAEELEALHPAMAARLWRRVAAWHRDHLDTCEAAEAALQRALELEPDDAETLSGLVELRRARGSWTDVATALERRIALETDPARRAELMCELAGVHDAQLGGAAAAVPLYERALATDPACPAAVAGLRRIHERTQSWDALAEVLARAAESAAAPADAIALHLERGSLFAHQGRHDEAVRAFQRALELDADHPGARYSLKEAYRAAGQKDAYLEAVEAELAGAPDPDRLADLAVAWEDHARLDRALASWQRLLVVDPRHPAGQPGLARTLERLARWPDLAAARRAHLDSLSAPAERLPVLIELAAVLESRLDDVDGAIRVLGEVLALAPHHRGAIDALGRLYERAGRWQDALAMLETLGAGDPDRRTRAELLSRAGRIHAGRGDVARAEARFRTALELDATNPGGLEGLALLHRAAEAWEPAVQRLLEAAEHHRRPDDVIRCLRVAADVYRGPLARAEQARACLARVLELDPDDVEAKRELGELLFDGGQWDALWPHLSERLLALEADPAASPSERIDALVRAARCAEGMRDYPRALALHDRALALDPGRATLHLQRAETLVRAQDWDRATEAYHRLLVDHAAALDTADRVGIFRQLGRVKERIGKAAEAIAFYDQALELDPRHRTTLEDRARLHLAERRWDEALGDLGALAGVVSPAEKPQVLERMGDLQCDRLDSPGPAVALYLAAVELDPANHRVLQKLLDLQSELGQWQPALETIARFLALETDPPRRALYHLAAANIRRFQLGDDPAALADLERALDAFFAGAPADAPARLRALEAFQAMDEILTAHKEWKRQERAYRALIKRLPADDPSLLALWHALGEIYRSRLVQPESAIQAFETAHALDPHKDPTRVQILGELYALVGRQAPERASDHASRLVEKDPENPEVYRTLARTCRDAGRIDEAWCACRALVLLKQATADEETFYRRHESRARRKAQGILDEGSWALVRDDAEDRVVSSILALVWDAAVAPLAGPLGRFGLGPRERLELSDDSRALAKIFRHAARVLNAPLPEVYLQPQRAGRLLLANCVEGSRLEPTLIVGRDLTTGYLDTELAYWIAATVTLLRPAYYLRLALPALDDLEAVLWAALQLAGRPMTMRPQLGPRVETFAATLHRHLSPDATAKLPALVARLGEAPDLPRWTKAVDTAARRAALLVCGDLAAALRMASAEPTHPGGPRAADKVRDLLVYSVSPAYFAARRHLNVMVARS
jgi:tetratricopeptide (TPR) repeat protein